MPQPPQVDLFDPVFKADPYPTYAQLRSRPPYIASPCLTAEVCGWLPATKTSWPSSRISGS
jgi:hypothetical protein